MRQRGITLSVDSGLVCVNIFFFIFRLFFFFCNFGVIGMQCFGPHQLPGIWCSFPRSPSELLLSLYEIGLKVFCHWCHFFFLSKAEESDAVI